MIGLGVAFTAAMVAVLVAEFLERPRRRFPEYGWLGLVALLLAEFLMFRGIEPAATFFTPLAWTCYLLIADAAVFALTGRSRLRNAPLEFVRMAALSVPLWLLFEAYNLRLANWAYVGLPRAWWAASLGFAWSFATITPAILETSDFVEALGWFGSGRPMRLSPVTERGMMLFGAACLIAPLVFPRRLAESLFALVWIGFFLLLDPVLHRAGRSSLLADLERGRRRPCALLVSGWICGWLWEFWNWWARAQWQYTFPMFQRWKIFAMPAPGYLGFPPFALDCFVLYVTAAWLLRWNISD